MPVSLLFCEGKRLNEAGGPGDAPDARLLRHLTKGILFTILPVGGKDGLRGLVPAYREAQRTHTVCALRDSDFPRSPDNWQLTDRPRRWIVGRTAGDGTRIEEQLGWQWARKEIENYFVDPDIVTRALRWKDSEREQYARRLDGVLDDLGPCTAGRMALTALAPKRDRLKTTLPVEREPALIRQHLQRRAADHTAGVQLNADALVAEFERLLPECQPGGRFRRHALDAFAGKNIRDRLDQTRGWRDDLKKGEGGDPLIERVLEALENDSAPHEWLPEWGALREAILAWPAETA